MVSMSDGLRVDSFYEDQLERAWYTNENIDQMLMERHINKEARRESHKNHSKGPRKRTEDDDAQFAQSFEKLILMAKER